jgi:FixJ family two-component response regulator
MERVAKVKLIAIVDDEESVRSALQSLIESVGLTVKSFASAENFLNSGCQLETGCLIADIRMPGMSGLDLQAKLAADKHPIPMIFITAHGDTQMRMKALRAGAVEFLEKPIDYGCLMTSIHAALEL